MQIDDSELVQRSKAGELEAFNEIVDRYRSLVFNTSARILGSRAAADDTAQETFISAYRSICRFRGGSLRAWLLRIATNASYDFLRSVRRRPEQPLDLVMERPSGEVSPEQHAEHSELGAQLQRAVLSLSPEQRTVLVLVDVQGLSYEEAAEATGVAVGTIRSRLSRARRRARDYLRKNTDLLPAHLRKGDKE